MDVFRRKELKFLIDASQRTIIEQALAEKMLPDRYPHSSIRNIYYDTPDDRLIRRSLERPIYKEKLRLRCYGDSKEVFLEVKKKYKGIVYKRRISMTEDLAEAFINRTGHLPDSQIAREMVYFRDFYRNLAPKVYLSYERDSWIGKTDPGLRITMDDSIQFRRNDLKLSLAPYGQQILPQGMSLLEVKAENAIPMWLTDLLAQHRIYQVSFSKYGRAYEMGLRERMKESRGLGYAR